MTQDQWDVFKTRIQVGDVVKLVDGRTGTVDIRNADEVHLVDEGWAPYTRISRNITRREDAPPPPR